MAEMEDQNRTSGVSPEGTGSGASPTQLGYPVHENVKNSDTAPDWEEQFNKQRKINRQLEDRKNELMQELEQVKATQVPSDKKNVDAKIDALADLVGKFITHNNKAEKESYVKKAVSSKGLPETLVDELKDMHPDKVDAILEAIPVPKKPSPKPDTASVTGAADAPAGVKNSYTEAELTKLPYTERMKIYEAGIPITK